MNSFKNYWGVKSNDIRLRTLQTFLASIRNRVFEHDSTEKIIGVCITALQQFHLSFEEINQLRQNILAQNTIVTSACLSFISHELNNLGNSIHIISLGCGDESLFERTIHNYVNDIYPNCVLHWIGVDIDDFRSSTSFLQQKPFIKVDPNEETIYRALVTTTNPVVLIGRWSYHHLGITFNSFLHRCRDLSKVILLEEPVTTQAWSEFDYRLARIAYDVIGNFVMSRGWAESYMDDSSNFRIQYVISEDLPKQAHTLHIPHTMPESTLISISPPHN